MPARASPSDLGFEVLDGGVESGEVDVSATKKPTEE